jgi:hypothetical protein
MMVHGAWKYISRLARAGKDPARRLLKNARIQGDRNPEDKGNAVDGRFSATG